MSLLHAAILLPFIMAVGISIFNNLLRRFHTGWFVVPGPILLFAYFLGRIPSVQDESSSTATVQWIPSLGIDFTVYLDGLGLLFALLITGIGSLVVLYSIFYLDKTKEAVNRFYVYLLLFMGAMLGVVLSDNLMVLYGFWELTSISSFLLIAFWHRREKSRYGALKSMLITVFGGFAMFAGFILLYTITGTFSIREMIGQAEAITGHALGLPAMLLILLGAFAKSAQFPFHIWLPDAMEAPTPVSAYLHSATMVKAGLYAVARFSPIFAGGAEWFWIVSGFGLFTLLYGAYRAIKQTDLKALLAFSTVSQLGLIMSLLGFGSAAAQYAGTDQSSVYTKAIAAAVFHLMNQAIFKGALFMVAGIVDHETGTRDIRKLGGLMALMPITFSVALIGSFSMAGLPPFSGFLSKEMFFAAALNTLDMDIWSMEAWSALFPVIAWTASVFTFVYSMLLLFRTFTGKLQPDKLARKPHEAPLGMLLPPVLLVSLAVIFGFFPNRLADALIEPAMASIIPQALTPGESFRVDIYFWHGWTTELLMTIGVAAAGTVLYKLYGRFKALNSPLFRRVSLNGAYDGALRSLERSSNRLTNAYMTGSVRHYLIYILAFFIAALGLTMIGSKALVIDASRYAPMSVYEAAVTAALILSAVAVPFARSRMTAIILTGASGYMVTLFFVLFRAPDLALTQMIVETVSVALFLLCFYHLPKLKREKVPLRFKLPNLVISAVVGAVVTLIALSASGSRAFDSISDFYLAESYNSAGGKNVVNVILVDFRGFDTLLEIMVLGIASLGIYALIKLGPDSDDAGAMPAKPADIHAPGGNDVILRTVSKAAIFIILTFAWFLFFAGHYNPGGGFIAGLMTAAALVLLSMAFGMKLSSKVIPVDFRKVTALGLTIALLTGIGSFLFDAPFLSHTFGYFELPLLGKTALATSVLFDLGVYLAVVGVTMTIIYTIGRDM
ncbi:MAG TPA: Na+/H+ antiporter subunit A [Paenibacillus sp.]|uniref:Na+/H+ antiporter subunit A n=1 Tax=Paenibacillus sp. TaxID=58172 RepID=UPI0028D4A103|nr:Na+/H+ antiporter subunit A [Paenibacillus sp.]HUC93992.1 Na+/H+ antiporter subunit A [Paenibacillus sp.]